MTDNDTAIPVLQAAMPSYLEYGLLLPEIQIAVDDRIYELQTQHQQAYTDSERDELLKKISLLRLYKERVKFVHYDAHTGDVVLVEGVADKGG